VVADIRRLAAEAGREPGVPRILALMTVITAPTDEAAHDKLADYTRYVSHEGALSVLSGWTGIDFAGFGLDEKLRSTKVDAIQTAIDVFTTDPGRDWTVREIAEKLAIGGPSLLAVGSPATVADDMERYRREAGVDGFNLARVVAPETFVDFVDLVVPELQARGLYKREYRPGTYREKLFGNGPHLRPPHPGAGYRQGLLLGS
jgi:alkanesulfonate monooxygenase SsuD/methylene tetrahydromethanopterin reductase-like flavin-dependent oxidoreductase (luciferase family)